MELALPASVSEVSESHPFPPTVETLAASQHSDGARRGKVRSAWRLKTNKLSVKDLLESMLPKETACPRCYSGEVIRYGKRKGIQRYKCKRCTKYFTGLSGTPFEGLHLREEFLEFALCMIQGLSVRTSARKVGVSKNTAFSWRHRIISKFAEVDARAKLNGIVEINQRLIPISYKGSRKFGGARIDGLPLPRSYWPMGLSRSFYHSDRGAVIIAMDRTGHVRAETINPARGGTFGKAMYSMVEKGATVCAQRQPGIWRRGNDYPEPICWIGKWQANGRMEDWNVSFGHPVYNVDNVRHLMLRFRNWMRRFNGVATKYLVRYAAWFWRVAAVGGIGYCLKAHAFVLSILQAYLDPPNASAKIPRAAAG
ncbi:MAG: hypothetical protein PHP20_05385 [Firmicutes bacterium]|nr:hypothetical protein [Bacillota bacterium]